MLHHQQIPLTVHYPFAFFTHSGVLCIRWMQVDDVLCFFSIAASDTLPTILIIAFTRHSHSTDHLVQTFISHTIQLSSIVPHAVAKFACVPSLILDAAVRLRAQPSSETEQKKSCARSLPLVSIRTIASTRFYSSEANRQSITIRSNT